MNGNNKLSPITIILSIVVVLSLVGNVYFYIETNNLVKSEADLQNELTTSQGNFDSLTATYDDYVGTHSHSDVDYDGVVAEYQSFQLSHSVTDSDHEILQSTYDSYVSSHTHTNSEYNSLQTTYDSYLASHSYTNSDYESVEASLSQKESALSTLQSSYYALEDDYETLDDDYSEVVTDFNNLLSDFVATVTYMNRPLENPITPTGLQVSNWLAVDNTDSMSYNSDFDCKEFSMVLSLKAKAQHWDMGVVAVEGTNTETDEYFGHAINFITTAEGLYYIEPQTDELWFVFFESNPDEHVPMEEGDTLRIPFSGPEIRITNIEIVVPTN